MSRPVLNVGVEFDPNRLAPVCGQCGAVVYLTTGGDTEPPDFAGKCSCGKWWYVEISLLRVVPGPGR